jgi:Uri superfamily endonuclease
MLTIQSTRTAKPQAVWFPRYARRPVTPSVSQRLHAMTTDPGTYALILRSRSKATTRVGRWGQIKLETGYYIYVGSAFGPGGVQARVLRHCRKNKSTHWHIDYLREFLNPVGAWYSQDRERLEHSWARFFSDRSGISSIQRFGCSDCKCNSHLFFTSKKPNLNHFSNLVGGDVMSWSYRHAG